MDYRMFVRDYFRGGWYLLNFDEGHFACDRLRKRPLYLR